MSCKIIFILLLVGLLAVKTTNAQNLAQLNGQISATLDYVAEHNPDSLSAITEQISSLSQQIMSAQGDPSKVTELTAQLKSVLANASNPSCGKLKNGKQYYLTSADQKFVFVDPQVQQAFMMWGSSMATKFTVVQKDCNLYGLCVDGYCMSRCENCQVFNGDYQSVRFHLTDSNSPWSQWVLSSVSGRADVYNLKVDNNFALAYKNTIHGEILSLDTQLTANSEFQFIEVVENCGIILENGKQYYIQQDDMRYAVLDPVKKLAFMRNVPRAEASKFTAVQKSCNVYGFCVDGACMSRCENCPSDLGDQQTVTFHLSNSDLPWSQWTLSPYPNQYGAPYFITAEPQYGNLIFALTEPGHEDQLTLRVTNEVTESNGFEFVKVY